MINLRAEAYRLRSVARELPEEDAIREIIMSLENIANEEKDNE